MIYIKCSNVLMYPSPKENNHRHPNKDVGMEKLPKINKRRAYFYSELKSNALKTKSPVLIHFNKKSNN